MGSFVPFQSQAGGRPPEEPCVRETKPAAFRVTALDQIWQLSPSTNNSMPVTKLALKQKKHRFGDFIGYPHTAHWDS
jgi:hypothetical protein